MYTRHPAQCHATCGVLTRLPAKLAKNGMRIQTSAEIKISCLYGIGCELVKNLPESIKIQHHAWAIHY